MTLVVTKRSGNTEPADFSKAERALIWASQGLSVDYKEIFNEETYVEFFYDGISTTRIQNLLANKAETKCTENWDWTYLAARLVLQKVLKEAHGNYPYKTETDYYIHFNDYLSRVEKEGVKQLQIERIRNHFDLDKITAAIKPERDLTFQFMGITTLADRYLIKNDKEEILEAPQHFFMRVALGLAFDEDKQIATETAIDYYNIYSSKEFLSSTPTLFNSATLRSQLSSCFVFKTQDDSLEGIYATAEEIAKCSKYSGGTANSMTPLRSKGSKIKSTGGKSSGVVQYEKLYEQTVRSFDQGGKRPGVVALYLETWHMDIFDFLNSIKSSGDERVSVRDVNLATWISDLFMKRLENDEDWTLFSPNTCPDLHELHNEEFEKAYVAYENNPEIPKKIVKAKDVWKAILTCLFNNKGNGWPCFKDTINRRSMTRGYGVVHSSNLCVAPETKVLTDNGHIEIQELDGQKVNVWNGKEFSEVDVVQTSKKAKLLKVILDNGAELECTPYHKFYVQENYSASSVVEIRAKNLKTGMKLIKSDLPIVRMEDAPHFSSAYTHGFFCGDGTYHHDGRKSLALYGEKKNLLNYLEISSTSGEEDNSGKINCVLFDELAEKFEVPSYHSLTSRVKWLSGLLDADGCAVYNGDNVSLQLASISKSFLTEIKLMLQTLGVDAKVKLMRKEDEHLLPDGKGGSAMFKTKEIHRLLINSVDTQLLLNLGLNCQRLKIENHVPQRSAKSFVKVVEVVNTNREDATYCFTEPKRNMGTFNGILTGQCTEITLRQGKSKIQKDNIDRVSVCNLGSVNLSEIKTKEQLEHVVRLGVKAIDSAISEGFIPIESGKLFNDEDRPLGLGIMGYSEFLAAQGIAYNSEEHFYAADILLEFISYVAIDESSRLGAYKGNFPMFEHSQWAKGELPIDTGYNAELQNILDSITYRNQFFEDMKVTKNDWEALRLRSSKNMRNSQLLAIAPTASIANIFGCTSCTELPQETKYQKTNLSGTFAVVSSLYRNYKDTNPKLVCDAQTCDPYYIVVGAATRQKWVDQSQSTNIWVDDTITARKLSDIYKLGWILGNKTFYYLRSVAPDIQVEEKYDLPIVAATELEGAVCGMEEGCLVCQ